MRRFVGLRLSGPLPDETTILNFRHLLEERQLGEGLMEEATWQGLRLREGTIGASIIEAPSNAEEWRWRARPTDASVAFWYESALGLRDGSGAS